MFKTVIAIVISTAILGGVSVDAADALRAELAFFQVDPETGKNVLLHKDTSDFVVDLDATGFFVGLSLNVGVTKVDSVSASFMVHAYSFAERSSNRARNFVVEYGLPARIDGLTGKNGALYSLAVTPLEQVDVDTTYCGFLHYGGQSFKSSPSANLDVYYLPNSLGDFHWNHVKNIFERDFRNFRRGFNLTSSGKYHLYLCPCKIPSLIWDDRFNMMVDPTRNTLFGVYSHDYNSVETFLILQAATYRNYGYAPPFLSEGLAASQSFAVYEMRNIVADGRIIPLDSLLDTYTYLQAEPIVADRTAGTFVSYLLSEFGVDKFLQLYKQSDDLNLRRQIQEVYERPVSELEEAWLQFVDTVTFHSAQIAFFRQQAEEIRDYKLAGKYAGEALRVARTQIDSLDALKNLIRMEYFNGDYYKAIANQKKYLESDGERAIGWMGLAGYEMIVGEYESAAEHMAKALEIDPVDQMVAFNRAKLQLCLGDTAAALEILLLAESYSGPGSASMQRWGMLGTLLAASKDETDRANAVTHLTRVTSGLISQSSLQALTASQTMWLGICYTGLGDTGNAQDFLSLALFLESRPLYRGMIHLWLGKVADLRGERDVAVDHYQQVLSGATAHYHQVEARHWLESPFEQ